MVNTGAWPKLLLLAALQLASLEGSVQAENTLVVGGITITALESGDINEASCPRLSAQSRSLFLALAEDPTCTDSSKTDSTCYNSHCRVCWTKQTDLNKNFECCDKLAGKTKPPPPTAAPIVTPPVAPPVAPPIAPPAVATEAPTVAPAFDPASIVEPTLSPTDAPTSAPTDAPTKAPTELPTEAPTEVPVVPSVTPSVATTDAPTDAPTVTTDAPSATPWVPTAAPVAPTDPPTDAPTAPSYAPPVASSDAPTAPSFAPPVAPPAAATDEPAGGAPTEAPWTPSEPTMPPTTDGDSSSSSSSDAAGDSDSDLSQNGSGDSSSSDDGSGSNAPAPDLCSGKLSEGDRNGGVRVVTDANCINGGLGCFDYVCRFCKIQDTEVATNFFECASFGYHFDGDAFDPDAVTDAPPTTSEPSLDGSNAHPNGQHGQSSLDGSSSSSGPGDCFHRLSAGDHAVGIRTIPDAKCLYGGLGCFDLECRYCKIADTDKSKHMFKCSNFGFHFVGDEFADGSGSIDETPTPPKPTDGSIEGSGNDSTDGSAEVPTVEPTTEPTTTPSDEPSGEPTGAPSEAPSEEPTEKPTEEPSGEPTEEPTEEPTSEPAEVPVAGPTEVEPTEKPTAAPTEVPAALIVTPAPEPTCDSKVSEGDARVGIDMVTDTSCVRGGLGCFGDTCRLCKVRATGDSDHLEWCINVLAAVAAAKTETPIVVVVQTEAPAPVATAWAPTGPCADQVSPGDRGARISAVNDANCYADGLGCFGDVCRYCKLEDTPLSSHLLPCAQFAPNNGSPFFQAAAAVVSDTSTEFTTLLKNKSIKWSLVGMAFVGAVAAVAMAAVGVTRAVRRMSSSTVEDADDDDDESDVEAGDDDALDVDDVEAPETQESARALQVTVVWSNDSAVLSTA